MDFLYNFPKQAKFEKILPKNKIYEHASPSTKTKNMFVQDVEKIIWSYKLSPATINIPETDDVKEIQIFTIILRNGELKEEVLKAVDKAIPSPIIFILKYEGKIQYVAAYKRPNEADKQKWVISDYCKTQWMEDSSKQVELPVSLNMGALYKSLLSSIIPLSFREKETLSQIVLRIEKLRAHERDAERLKSQIKKEKQFNRRVDLNSKLRQLNKEIEKLSA